MAEFKPHLTPSQMLEMGVFGGNYFREATEEDFRGLDKLTFALAVENVEPFQKRKNYYDARAGESYEQWMANGWIFPEDPLGWFHWYCRWHAGRRHERDAHQISRHINYGLRWGRYARTQMLTRGDASSVVKQGLLQWGFSPMVVLHGDV